MSIDALKYNLEHIKEITREIYVFTSQLSIINNLETKGNVLINKEEKQLLSSSIESLTKQLKILNNSIPSLISNIGFYKKISGKESEEEKSKENLVLVNYNLPESEEKVSLIINDRDRKEFLENLSKSNLTINTLKKKYAVHRTVKEFGKPNFYAKLSNKLFKKYSNDFVSKGYFMELNSNLRKMNSPFVLSTYLSMIFFSMLIGAVIGIFLMILLMFFNVSLSYPFFSKIADFEMIRLLKVFWIIFAIPLAVGFIIYYYPRSESKSLSSKINKELPFVAIHMSAIATSGVDPVSIFKIILKNEEYESTNIEFRKLLNLVNFHGKDIVTALKIVAKSSPSPKLRELLDGLATTITSGGSLHEFLDKHAETLLFDYKLEIERYTKISETMMDIYISIVIAAPMILLMLLVIIGSAGGMLNFLGLSTRTMSMLINLIIILLNVGFLILLRVRQPKF
jgi:flagellar protein FlaJ